MRERGVFPGIHVVTIEAGGWKTGSGVFVVVILLVAGNAILVVLCVEDGGVARDGVARRTIGLLVRAEELESVSYLLVRERGIIPGVDVVAI